MITLAGVNVEITVYGPMSIEDNNHVSPQGGSSVTNDGSVWWELKRRRRKVMGRLEGGISEWKCSFTAASMTDAEAQSAPPPAPVEERTQAERKVIGGSAK